METITVVLVVFAVLNLVFITAFLLKMERRYAERLAAADERERALQTALELERIARVEEAATYTERLAAAEARERALPDAPVALAGVAERSATLVLAALPLDRRERDEMAKCATLGSLMTTYHYIGVALEAMLKKADLSRDIFHMRTVDEVGDDFTDDDDDGDRGSDPSKLQ